MEKLLSAVATIFFGGVVAAVVTYLLTAVRMRKEIRLRKLEELTTLIHEEKLALVEKADAYYRVAIAKLRQDELRDVALNARLKRGLPNHKMMALVELSLNELKPAVKNFLEVSKQLDKVKPNANRDKTDNIAHEAIKQIDDILKKHAQAEKEVMDKIMLLSDDTIHNWFNGGSGCSCG
jgi:hypothetical protein